MRWRVHLGCIIKFKHSLLCGCMKHSRASLKFSIQFQIKIKKYIKLNNDLISFSLFRLWSSETANNNLTKMWSAPLLMGPNQCHCCWHSQQLHTIINHKRIDSKIIRKTLSNATWILFYCTIFRCSSSISPIHSVFVLFLFSFVCINGLRVRMINV